MSKKPETKFKERCIEDLKTLPNVWFVKIQQVALRGIPDFFICLNGFFVAIELKASKTAHRDELQKWTLGAIANANGKAIVAYPENWDATMDWLRGIATARLHDYHPDDPQYDS